jgi:hypothetical protein
MQSEHRGHGWTDNLVVQITGAVVVTCAIIAIAWFTVF